MYSRCQYLWQHAEGRAESSGVEHRPRLTLTPDPAERLLARRSKPGVGQISSALSRVGRQVASSPSRLIARARSLARGAAIIPL